MNSQRALLTVEFSSDLLAGPDGREALYQLQADAQALADVRTLDAFAEAECIPTPAPWRAPGGGFHVCVRAGVYCPGPTPDAARAKAAAWVRDQAAPGK